MQELLRSTTAYDLLEREKKTDRLANAYLLLFSDERNLRLALRTFATTFFPYADERIPRETHPDCLFFPEEGKTLSVADAEKIVEESALSPVEGAVKLFVLDGFHRAQPVVQNKLLKVLEEPPTGVYFLLGAASEFPVLATVKSRAKRLEIPPFSADKVEECLYRLYPNEQGLSDYAAACDGQVGVAQELIGGGKFSELINLAVECVSAPPERVPLVTRALSQISDKSAFLALVARVYRDILFYATGQPYASLKSVAPRLKEVAKNFSAGRAIFALEQIQNAEKELSFYAPLPSCMEIALLNIEKEKGKL